jgi:AbrB family looped-hinge helix DNA binding protein
METTATTKGQIVIPAEMRKKLMIREGTRIQVELDEEHNRIILTPVTREYIHSLRGSLKGKGALKILEAERRKERG